jgi:hypothetical protein
MKSTINVSKEYIDGIIRELDSSRYFLLGPSNENATRAELFHFALALGLKNGNPSKLKGSIGLIRTSYIDTYSYLYKSIYYDKVLSTDESQIDQITDIDAAIDLVEQYANTGFDVLTKLKAEFPDDTLFMKKILSLIDEMQKDYLSVYGVKEVYSE